MNGSIGPSGIAAIAAGFAAVAALAGAADSGSSRGTTKLLTANFEPRQVVRVEAGDFLFKPGQAAPVHTHVAPAVGIGADGAIELRIGGDETRRIMAGRSFSVPMADSEASIVNVSPDASAKVVTLHLR